MGESEAPRLETRRGSARIFTWVEDFVYFGLGFLLAATVIVLLGSGFVSFVRAVSAGSLSQSIIGLLDQILLILLVVELLYTVQVSLRAHALVPEPFLLVGLISAIRRVLVLTAEFSRVNALPKEAAHQFIIELAVLSGLILALAISLVQLRGKNAAVARG
jgi:uncharacterized membrane protein (DUF373 family)